MKTLEHRQRKPRLPKELKRTHCSIKARTYSFLVSELERTAKSCGMTKPEYILARTFGLQPRLALTDNQVQGMQQLNDCRIDMMNFASAFKKMSGDARRQLESYIPNLRRWLDTNRRVADACKEFIDDVCASDKLPRSHAVMAMVFVKPTYDIYEERRLRGQGRLGDYDAEIMVRVSEFEKTQVMMMAAKLGISGSDLMRMRCFGYSPKPRLSEWQEQRMLTLKDCRSDIIKFTEAKRKMQPGQQEQIFNDAVAMLKWLKAVNAVVESCRAFVRDCIPRKKSRNREKSKTVKADNKPITQNTDNIQQSKE